MPTISNDKLSNSGINKQRAQFLFNKWDPSGGFDGFNWVLSQLFGNHKGGEAVLWCCMALLGIDSITGIWKNFNNNGKNKGIS